MHSSMNQPTKQSIQQSLDPSKLYTWMSNPKKQSKIHEMQFRFSCSATTKCSFPYPSTAGSKRTCLKYGMVMYMTVLKKHFDEMKASPERVDIWMELNIDNICSSRWWINSQRNILSKLPLTDTGANRSKWIPRQGASLRILTDTNGYHTWPITAMVNGMRLWLTIRLINLSSYSTDKISPTRSLNTSGVVFTIDRFTVDKK